VFVLGGIGFYVALSPLAEFAEGRIGLLFLDAALYALLIRLYFRRASTETMPRTNVVPSS
jgi:hypothetical protein